MRNLTVFFFFLGCLRVEAHVGDVIYPIFELTDADLAQIDLNDGSVADWETILGAPTLTREDAFRYVAPPNCASCVVEELPAPDDLDFAIWLGWHDSSNRLYFAAERFDDVLLGPVRDDFGYWGPDLRDDFGLLIDGDHQGDDYIDWEIIYHCNTVWFDPQCVNLDSQWRLLSQQYYIIPSKPNGWTPTEFFDWSLYPPFADGGGQVDTSASPSHWVTEFYVTPFDTLLTGYPITSRISPLFDDKIIGFDVIVTDIDDPNESGHFSLSGDYEAYYHARFLVDGLLVGKASPTQVEQETWGRIKASLVP